jgi:F-type H+-transporting ATPase subunit delta
VILNRKLARRYAVAVGELAWEQHALERVRADLGQVKALLSASPEFLAFLSEQKIGKERQIAELHRLLGEKVHRITLHFLMLVVWKRRAEYLPQMIEEFELYADEVDRVLAVKVTTAMPLRGDQQQALSRAFTARTGQRVRLVARVDPALLGGLKVQIGDRVWDGSVAGRLRRLQRALQAAE